MRWGRVKSNLLRACVVKGLEAFLKKNLDYDFYQDYAEDLTTTLQGIVPEKQDEGFAHTLALDCAQDKSEAIRQADNILNKIGIVMDEVLDDARVRKAPITIW